MKELRILCDQLSTAFSMIEEIRDRALEEKTHKSAHCDIEPMRHQLKGIITLSECLGLAAISKAAFHALEDINDY